MQRKSKILRKKLRETMKKKLCCITKGGKKLKTSQAKNVSLIYPRWWWGEGGGGETVLLRTSIFCFLLLFFYLSFVFSLFFVCVCVIIFCGSLVFLFWFYLIKSEINITKKKKIKEKIQIQAIYLVSCYRKYTKTVFNSFWLLLLLSAFCYCGHFCSIFCKNRTPRFHGFIVKMTTSWSLWVCQSNYR